MDKIQVAQALSHKFPVMDAVRLAGIINRDEWELKKVFTLKDGSLADFGIFGYWGEELQAFVIKFKHGIQDAEYLYSTYKAGSMEDELLYKELASLLAQLPAERDDIVMITKWIVGMLDV